MSINKIFLDVSVDSCAHYEIKNLRHDWRYLIRNFSRIKFKTLNEEYVLNKYTTNEGAVFFNRNHKISIEFNLADEKLTITSYFLETLKINELIFEK